MLLLLEKREKGKEAGLLGERGEGETGTLEDISGTLAVGGLREVTSV